MNIGTAQVLPLSHIDEQVGVSTNAKVSAMPQSDSCGPQATLHLYLTSWGRLPLPSQVSET